jgi:hypothetical protein
VEYPRAEAVDEDVTLGEAFLAGWEPHVRCLRGSRNGPAKIEPCGYTTTLDLESLIWTRGATYPCWRLRKRLKCPRCGGLAVRLSWSPGASRAERARRDLCQCVAAAIKP